MDTVAQQIIDKIQRNRISSTEVADCLDKSGALVGVRALNRGHHRVGPVFYSYAYNESNWEVHEQVREVPKGSIVITDAFDCGDRAIYGNLVAKFLILYRQAGALVACGLLRDLPHLIKENWPVWLEGSTPVGCFNRKNDKPLDSAKLRERRDYFNGAIAVCDDTGVVIISRDYINADFLKKLDWIEEQEDVWFDCIDRKKWDTFDTVCLKRYEKESK
ncbi:MAG: RraA family protein [Planctomycetaceae bacterium]